MSGTRTWPDMYDKREPQHVLCPRCYQQTFYALNTHRYVCEVHGPVTTGEMTYGYRGDSRGDLRRLA